MGHVRSRRGGCPQASSGRRRAAALALGLPLLAAGAALAAGCGSDDPEAETPVAALSDSPDAGFRYNRLLRDWVLGSSDVRQQLDKELERFEKDHPEDDLVRMARVLRAWNALERDEPKRARELAQDALLGPPGTPHDLGVLVAGAAERRLGHHKKALGRLAPLLHKLIDPFATELLDRELVEAAIGAGRHRLALRYMAIWLRETDRGSRRLVIERIGQQLRHVSAEDLLVTLDELAADDAPDGTIDMARLLTARLAVLARQARDSSLAKELLDKHGGLLGGQGEAIARLATDTNRVRVTAGTVGLLLSLAGPVVRRRSADVTVGMTFGLGLPGSGARLVVREAAPTARAVSAKLRELSAEGAAVVVAGLDPQSSQLAADYGQRDSLPLLLLTPPGKSAPAASSNVFVVGVDPAQTERALVEALQAAGAQSLAGFGLPGEQAPNGSSPKTKPATRGGSANTVLELGCPGPRDAGELRRRRVTGLLVRDGAACGPELLPLARTLRATLGVGLGVVRLSGRLPSSARVLSAGIFPVQPDAPPALLGDWMSSGRGLPSWWIAVGRDAAVLAREASKGGDSTGTDDPKQVAKRRSEMASRLASASARLWTSEARGFAPDRTLPRKVRVRSAEASRGGDAAR